MATLIAANLLSASRIKEAAKKLDIGIRIVNPGNAGFDDDFYIIDCNRQEGVEAAKKVKGARPDARVVCFYPHVKAGTRKELEKLGCAAFANAKFFSNLEEILKSYRKKLL